MNLSFTHLNASIVNKTLWLKINNPSVGNAISLPMVLDFERALADAEADDSIAVVVIAAEGKIFCSGGDVQAMQDQSGMFAGDTIELRQNYINGIQRIPVAFEKFTKPLIASVQGAAVGAGCDLAMMCDLRIGCDNTSFGETFAKMSLIAGDGGAYFLARAVGYAKAMQMTLTAEMISGDKAFSYGLLNYFTTNSQLEEKTQLLADKISSLPPLAVRWNKLLVKKAYRDGLSEILESAATYQGILQRTPEHFAAVKAFLAKNK